MQGKYPVQAGPSKPAGNFAAGAVAAVAATVLTQPTDVLRTRLQLLPAAGAPRVGSFATMAAIMRSQGARGLWAGTVPRVRAGIIMSAFGLASGITIVAGQDSMVPLHEKKRPGHATG